MQSQLNNLEKKYLQVKTDNGDKRVAYVRLDEVMKLIQDKTWKKEMEKQYYINIFEKTGVTVNDKILNLLEKELNN